jgi:hypothetical protein
MITKRHTSPKRKRGNWFGPSLALFGVALASYSSGKQQRVVRNRWLNVNSGPCHKAFPRWRFGLVCIGLQALKSQHHNLRFGLVWQVATNRSSPE